MADVLVNLHGAEHRDRRRLENRLFRREAYERYEVGLFPPIIDETLDPEVAAGGTELVDLGHRLMMNLAALTAGVDRPLRTADETRHLYSYLMRVHRGRDARLTTRAIERRRPPRWPPRSAEFDREFLAPSLARRAALLEAGEDLPHDVLSILAGERGHAAPAPRRGRARGRLLPARRGAHVGHRVHRVLHNVFTWLGRAPGGRRSRADRPGLPAALHPRDHPPPAVVAGRDALGPRRRRARVRPGDPRGVKVVIDLMQVNRDTSAFGADAARFNPHRVLADRVAALRDCRSAWACTHASARASPWA